MKIHYQYYFAWLKNQIANTENDDPWSAVTDLLGQRRDEQRVRSFLHTLFKTKLPAFLKPQPVIIVVDQAEELLRAYTELSSSLASTT